MSCIDIIAVKYPDNTYKCSPLFIRFSSKPSQPQVVKVYVNNVSHPQNTFANRRILPDDYTGDTVLVVRAKDKYPFFVAASDYMGRATNRVREFNFGSIETSDEDSSAGGTNGDTTKKKIKKRTRLRRALSFSSVSDVVSDGVTSPTSPLSPNQSRSSWTEKWLERIDGAVHPHEKLCPCSDFIKKMNLTQEKTPIRFVANGECIQGFIYLWDSTSSIVLSDIDGTITRSDKRGQLLAKMGKCYVQRGIIPLFNNLENKGYKFLYLTARPITHCRSTKEFIQRIRQTCGDVELQMPDGPIITAPNKVWHAFAREVIIRRPDSYKIAILNTIKSLFPENPFVAGYGNRPSDDHSYISIGIDPKRAYRLNPKGECFCSSNKYESLEHLGKTFEQYGLFPKIHMEGLQPNEVPAMDSNLAKKFSHLKNKIQHEQERELDVFVRDQKGINIEQFVKRLSIS
jgi:phosphatidate phosphatase PAH1